VEEDDDGRGNLLNNRVRYVMPPYLLDLPINGKDSIYGGQLSRSNKDYPDMTSRHHQSWNAVHK